MQVPRLLPPRPRPVSLAQFATQEPGFQCPACSQLPNSLGSRFWERHGAFRAWRRAFQQGPVNPRNNTSQDHTSLRTCRGLPTKQCSVATRRVQPPPGCSRLAIKRLKALLTLRQSSQTRMACTRSYGRCPCFWWHVFLRKKGQQLCP